jgi:hypothetical protein
MELLLLVFGSQCEAVDVDATIGLLWSDNASVCIIGESRAGNKYDCNAAKNIKTNVSTRDEAQQLIDLLGPEARDQRPEAVL